MPQPKTLGDILTEVIDCDDKMRSCLVKALLITDADARIKAGLKCLTDNDDYRAKAVKTLALTRDISTLQKLVRKGQK